MKAVVFLLATACAALSPLDINLSFNVASGDCSGDVSNNVSAAMVDFDTRFFKHVAKVNDNHFVLSEYSVWLMTAALAEGASESIKNQLFEVLNLPKDPCLRYRYYEQAMKHERSGSDLKHERIRLLALDESLALNQSWVNDMKSAGLLETLRVPLKSNPKAAFEQLSKYAQTELMGLPADASSVLLDTFDYKGLWSTAFPNAYIHHDEPFYNEAGEKIASVDYIRMKRLISFATFPNLHTKVLEIPVGVSKSYSLFIFSPTDSTTLDDLIGSLSGSIVEEIYKNLQESKRPIEIGLPRFRISSYHDNLELSLGQIGLKSLFTDSLGTEQVSRPPAMPAAYIQRVTVDMDVTGLQDKLDKIKQTLHLPLHTGLAEEIDDTYTVNRPFVFAFINARSKTCIFSGAYSKP